MTTDVLYANGSGEPARRAMGTGGEAGRSRSRPDQRRLTGREKITPYDFKRPERVGKEQMRALQTLHEGFGRNFGAALSALLRSIVEVKLTSVDQLTYSEFVFSLENPSCFNLLKADPLEGNLILDINPSILYPIIDRLLGGGREMGRSPGGRSRKSSCGWCRGSPGCSWNELRRRLGERAGPQAGGTSGGEQPAVGANRAAQRGGGRHQLRVDDRRPARNDEPLRAVQFDRADRRQALGQQLGLLRPRHASPETIQQISETLWRLAGGRFRPPGADEDRHGRANGPSRGRRDHDAEGRPRAGNRLGGRRARILRARSAPSKATRRS